MLAGLEEALNMLKGKNLEVWAVDEGETFEPKETVLRITGPYKEFAILKPLYLGHSRVLLDGQQPLASKRSLWR